MALELEQTIMAEIGLGVNYRYFNGSGSCEYIRRDAVARLPDAASNHGLEISTRWLTACQRAIRADQNDSDRYGLTKTWMACSNAIQDAIYRNAGGEGFTP